MHDHHAEVLARRGLRRWILKQLILEKQKSTTNSSLTSSNGVEEAPIFIPWSHAGDEPQPSQSPGPSWLFNDQVYRLHLYISRAPCGDASASLLLDEDEHAGAEVVGNAVDAAAYRGRKESALRGRVRTKPGKLPRPFPRLIHLSDCNSRAFRPRRCTTVHQHVMLGQASSMASDRPSRSAALPLHLHAGTVPQYYGWL